MSTVSKATDNDGHNADETADLSVNAISKNLMETIERGDVDAARLLLQRQADVDYVMEETKMSPLGVACKKGHPDIVRMLLDKGAQIELKSKGGRAPLYLAVVCRSLDIVHMLISHGADIGALGPGGQSCLTAAVSVGSGVDMVHALLTAGADVNWKRGDGLSALHLACHSGRTDQVETLLEQPDIEFDARTADGVTALHMAAAGGRSKIVTLLLDHGAFIDASSDAGPTCLMAAVGAGHTDVVEILLTNGANINALCQAQDSRHGVTALGIACQQGDLDVVGLLLESGAELETRNSDGRAALSLAADNGYSGVVQLLLSNHADATARQNKSQSCLLSAVFFGSSEIVRSLLQAGAEVNTARDDGVCPLHVASQLGRTDIVVTLLDAGADHSVRTQDGSTALFLAVSCGRLDVVDVLISRHAYVNVQNNNGVTLLFAAVMRGNTPLVKRLLEAGAASDVNTPRTGGMHPLHVAAQIGNAEIVHMLLKGGARIETQTDDGCTPLLQAAAFGRVRVVRMLAGQGADCQTSNQAGDTCLISAAFEHRLEQSTGSYRHVETVVELIQLGADVDRQNRQGLTALGVAAEKGNLEMVRLLIEHGANVHLRNNDGYTALYWACQNAHLPVVKTLIDQNANANVGVRSSCLVAAVMANSKPKEIAEVLIGAGANVNFQRPVDALCPLAFASSQGLHEIVKLLLDNEAKTELKDTEGHTPLWNAASRGHIEVVQLLMSAGAEVDACNDDGQSCLLIAAMSQKVDLRPLSNVKVTKVVRALLKAGAKVNSRGNDGYSPLAAAAQNGNLDVVRQLLDNGADIDQRINSGCSPLWIASERGPKTTEFTDHIGVITLLLDRGADINSLGSEKSRSPLLQAAISGNDEMVGVLLERGADANSFDIDMSSALLLAASHGHVGAVKILLEHGLEVNSRSYYETPLTAAAGRGYLKVVNLLLDYGAELFARNNDNMTALETALYGGHMKVMKRLSDAQVNVCVTEAKSRDEPKVDLSQCNSALHETHDVEDARQLLANGADVDAENVEGLRPIHCAVRSGLVELVQLLIEHGANVDASDILGNRPLHEAAYFGLDVVELLFTHAAMVNVEYIDKDIDGVRVNVQNIDGKTPLHIAIEREQSDLIKSLLHRNADVTITDVWRNTPLHYLTRVTANQGDIFILVQQLITNNFRRFIQPNVIDISALQHLQTVCHYRTQHPRNLDLHNSGVWPEQLDEPVRDRFGNTALHYVVGVHAERKLTPVSANLCGDFMAYSHLGVDVRNTSGQTPLHVARGLEALTVCVLRSNPHSFSVCDRRWRNFWHLLRNRGISVKTIVEMVTKVKVDALREGTTSTCRDDFGRTPLHYACMRGSGELVKVLVKHSPQSVKAADHLGRTPLHYLGLNGSKSKSLYTQLLDEKADETIQDNFQSTAKDYRRYRAQFDLEMNIITLFSSASYISKNFDRIVRCIEMYQQPGQGTHELRDILHELREGHNVSDYLKELLDKSRFNYRNFQVASPPGERHSTFNPTSRGDVSATPGEIRNRVDEIMKNLAIAVEQQDERFKCHVVAVGSGYEGTKVGCFDEFDYMFVLEKLSNVCAVRQSPESPAGFVQLATSAEKLESSQYISELFNNDFVLDTPAANFIFESIVRELLSAGQFQLENKFELTDEEKMFGHSLTKINTEVSIRLTSFVAGHPILHDISLDVVPAIHLDDWWPRPEHARLQNVTAKVRKQGCYLVFTQPQVKYPWIGWTQPHAFISFAKAESRLLHDSPQVVKDAFMVVKRMAKYMSHQVRYTSYAIKTAALYSLRDFPRTEPYDSCNYQKDLVSLVRNMLKRLLCYAAQDYVESYFVVDYIPPVWNFERQRKFNHTRLYQHQLTPQDLFAVTGPDAQSFYEREKNDKLRDSSLNAILKSVVFSHLMYWVVLSDDDQLMLYFPDERQRSPICERSCWAKFSNFQLIDN